jgi:hypothetical protein
MGVEGEVSASGALEATEKRVAKRSIDVCLREGDEVQLMLLS